MNMEAREGELPSITFKQALIDATFQPGRVYAGPDRIDLDKLQPDVEEMIDATLSHPERHENAKVIYVNSDRRVFINRAPIPGGDKHVRLETEINYLNVPGLHRLVRQQRFIGSIGHSHPFDSPFSPTDLSGIFFGDQIPDALTSCLLITPERKLLAFRGPKTPHMSIEQTTEILTGLNNAVLTRIRQFANPNMTELESQDISIRANRSMFRQIASKYDIQVFEGGARDRFLTKVPADQIAA